MSPIPIEPEEGRFPEVAILWVPEAYEKGPDIIMGVNFSSGSVTVYNTAGSSYYNLSSGTAIINDNAGSNDTFVFGSGSATFYVQGSNIGQESFYLGSGNATINLSTAAFSLGKSNLTISFLVLVLM